MNNSRRDEDWVMISALEHWSYCPRQCGLIHLEQVFDENLFTLRGRMAHERADQPETRRESGVRIERALPLWCERLGLIGKADIVEFGEDGAPYPVEYKHGPRRPSIHDDIQLCAQALCLEEMLGLTVPTGAIFSYSSKRRREVTFDQALRELTEQTVRNVRAMLADELLPPAINDKRCRHCSLRDACLPQAICHLDSPGVARSLFHPHKEATEFP